MQTLDQNLQELVKNNLITASDAAQIAVNKTLFE
jgi:Tfp pilus assembly ATPase PilU